ncbi:MAG TPA: ROK family protein [Mesorhizobium sp.]|uniref:ROK family protein n=1 Tax=Mesorhizobium sp. TaxID=1871066 RepID=UPI002DDDB238|nr:ROK family protein [Mesorhizobium sp.]HEV2505083.1 ROK family protein [Mesorhizobium sp.]
MRSKGAFRTGIARDSNLTEASVSRILNELRKENIVEEKRQQTSNAGAPTAFVTLSKDIAVLGIELSNSRLSFGVGDLKGTLDYVERMPASPQLSQQEFERLFAEGTANVREWISARGIALRQAAMSVPGFGREGGNPIYPWDMRRLALSLSEVLPGVPLTFTNSVIAQAAFHRYSHPAGYGISGDHLFLFAGHGVAGVIVNDTAPVDAFSAFEIGHMVIERDGLPCRCGHKGCLEAYTSLRAISPIIGLSDADILTKGDRFMEALGVDPAAREALRERQFLLGLALGNALNLHSVPKVVISGWPSLMPEVDRAAIADGLNQSLLGGYSPERLELSFIEPLIGNDPKAALHYAAYCFVRGGGLDEKSGQRAALEEIA